MATGNPTELSVIIVTRNTRALTTAAGCGFAVVLLLPHLTLLLVSLVPYGAWTTEILPPVLNFDNYRRLLTEPERLRPLFNSFWMAAISRGGSDSSGKVRALSSFSARARR